MEPLPTLPRGRHFEEFEVGGRLRTPARTVTEGDIVTFAGVSGDYNLIHTDEVYATGSGFGRRVAHGLLGLSIVSGLAFREINEWKFSLPVFIGETIHAELEIDEIKPLPRLGGGLVGLTIDVKNQRGQSVMKGRWTVLVASKPTP